MSERQVGWLDGYWRWRLRYGPRFTPEGQEKIVRRLLYGRWA